MTTLRKIAPYIFKKLKLWAFLYYFRKTTWRRPWCLLYLRATPILRPVCFIEQLRAGSQEFVDWFQIQSNATSMYSSRPQWEHSNIMRQIFLYMIFINIDQRRSLVYITVYPFNCIWSLYFFYLYRNVDTKWCQSTRADCYQCRRASQTFGGGGHELCVYRKKLSVNISKDFYRTHRLLPNGVSWMGGGRPPGPWHWLLLPCLG